MCVPQNSNNDVNQSEAGGSNEAASNNEARGENRNEIEEDDVAVMKQAVIAGTTAASNSDTSGIHREDLSVQELPVLAAVDVGIGRESQREDGRKLIGKKVETTFGVGVVLDYRVSDKIYEIQITNNGSSNSDSSDCSIGSLTMLYTANAPRPCPETQSDVAKKLNVAYEALEKMRRLNLDIQCHEVGIPGREIDYDMCTVCLMANGGSTKSHFPVLQRWLDTANTATSDLHVGQQFSRFGNFFQPAPSVSNPRRMASRTSASLQDPAATASTRLKPPPRAASASTQVPPADDTKMPPKEALRNEPSSSPKHVNGENDGKPVATNNPIATTPPTTSTTNDSFAANRGGENIEGSPEAIEMTRDTAGKRTEPEQNTTQKLTETRTKAGLSAHHHPSTTNKRAAQPSKRFPRINRLWGNMRQPAAPKMSPPTPTVACATGGSLGQPSTPGSHLNKPSMVEAVPNSSSSSSARFPRIQGLINNPVATSITTSIFGETKVKHDGTLGDPSIIMHSRSSSVAPTHSAKPPPVNNSKPIALPRIQRLMNRREKANTFACLICASPSCPTHSSASFRKEGITLCLKCERLFELDFIVDCVSTSDSIERAWRVNYMIDCYDRCMLLLNYSRQFVLQIAASLKDQREKQDKIGLASSSVGVLSGVLGIAAAASILTPAGPPLLIASLFFGGGATTVQTGAEAINYLSEPRVLADRIIALHGMALSILRVTSTLRDALLRDHIRTDVYEVLPKTLKNQVKEQYEKNKNAVVMGSNFGRSLTLGGTSAAAAAAGAGAATEVGVVVGGVTSASATAGATGAAAATRSATAISRAGTAAARTVRFARFAGGALSAAVLVMEANAIQSTLKSIRHGSPCDKADALLRVIEEIDEFPSTEDLDDECQAYLDALTARPPPPVEACALADDGSNANVEIPEATWEQVEHTDVDQLSPPGAVIIDRNDSPDDLSSAAHEPQAPTAVPVASPGSSFIGGSSSLFQQLQHRRDEHRSLAASAASEVIAVAVEDSQLEDSNFSLVL